MATFDWPESILPATMEWGTLKSQLQFQSPYNGTLQVLELVAEKWVVSFEMPASFWSDAGEREAFFERLTGGANRVRVYHVTRPVPRGTMRGTPTLQTAASRGDASVRLATSQPGCTLRAGDLFNLGGQLFKSAELCIADGAGSLLVPLVHRVRKTTSAGSAVQWDRPTGEFIMPSSTSKLAYQATVTGRMVIDLQEAW